MAVRIDFNKRAILKKITIASSKGQEILSQQVLKDSNFYAKEDSGALIASSLLASDTKKGILVWNTPYARKQYYTGRASKDVNSNAQKLWFEVAKKNHLKEWILITDKIIKKGV